MKKFPPFDPELLNALEEAFPDKMTRRIDLTPTAIGVLIGQQTVLDFLRKKLSKQNIIES